VPRARNGTAPISTTIVVSSTPPYVVVDASIAAKWLLTEDGSNEARTLLRAWLASAMQPIAPDLFGTEIANIMHQQVRRGMVTHLDARELLRRVLAVVALVPMPVSDILRAFDIAALTGQQTPYDAQYLALAERVGGEYWTADARFVRGAQAVFPQVKAL